MASYFCVTVRFLQPYFHGRTDRAEPEWPPSPLRLFQALVAAAAKRWQEIEFRERGLSALQWLEKLSSPRVIAMPAQPADSKFRLYVPDNVADRVAKSWSGGREASIADYRTEKDVRPMRLCGDAVHYLFPLTDTEFAKHRDVLVSAAHALTHLGWGIDMVATDASVVSENEATRLPGERWLPTEDAAAAGYRVPVVGTLADLSSRHQAFLNRVSADGFNPVPPLTAYRVIGYRRESDPATRPWTAFKLLHPETGEMRSYAMTNAVRIAGMIRGTAGKVAKGQRDPNWVDQFVYGHHKGPDTLPRFSYLPLPSIQPVVGVGRIRRVMIAEAPGAPGHERKWINRLLSGQVAIAEQGNHALLVPLSGDKVLSHYVGKSAVWTTVTPIALPGCDDGKDGKRAKLFERAMTHAGYSLAALKEAPEFRRFSFLPGGEDSLKFRPGGDHYLRNCSVYHVRLHWKNPFKGPLALGSGRHCGLGIFAAVGK